MAIRALTDAETFLRPVTKREQFALARGASIVDRIYKELSLDVPGNQTTADIVVWHGLSLLENIHQEMLKNSDQAEEILRTPALRTTIDALLDLISLEGIYPRLSPGVGAPIERRVRSVLQGGTNISEIKDQNGPDSTGLDVLAKRLYAILLSHQGVALAIEQRTLVDVLAGMAQLAYSPQSLHSEVWSKKLEHLINSLSPTLLFPSLISLLHSNTPAWLKDHVAVPLSLLPMRPDGVRQTIAFVAKSTPQKPAQNAEASGGIEKGPMLSLEVLGQVSKVLSAVPSTVSAKEYFENIAPQLFLLLEDKDPDTRRAAAFTVSHGILSKRQFGHPTAIGWKCFVQPLLTAINPVLVSVEEQNTSPMEITQALKVLTTILSEFPNPGLTKRILSPIVLSLWAISCSSTFDELSNDLAIGLLKLYIRVATGSEGLHLIADNLMYETNAQNPFKDTTTNAASIVDQVSRRSSLFMSLVEICDTDKELGEFFASVLKKALQQPSTTLDGEVSFDDAMKKIVYSHIVQEMISKLSSKIAADASSSLPIIEEVLRGQISAVRDIARPQTVNITRSSLAMIVQNTIDEYHDNGISDLENSISICLPWVMIILQQGISPESEVMTAQLASIRVLLESILYIPMISQSTKQSIRFTTTLLSTAQDRENISNSGREATQDEDVNLHSSAMKNLQAIEPPIRVQGLSELETLVLRGSPLVSISSATLTTISLLQDQDSFVYLSAVKLLVVLAKKDPQSTLKILQEAYQDITEQSTLDIRLRIGEALQSIIEEVGKLLPPNPVARLSELLLYIASRRVYRSKAHLAEKNLPKLPRQREEQPEDDSDSDVENDHRQSEKDVQVVLESWQGKSGAEDLRVRMSALTILGAIFEHVDFSAISAFIHPSLELVSRILNSEKGQENAIIRRAAVLTALSIIRGAEHLEHDLAVATSNVDDDISLENIDTLFMDIAAEDDDDIVRGHAENLVQAIRDWREESLNRLMRGDAIRFGLASGNRNVRLRGIDLNLNTASASSEQGIRKIEEID